MSSGFPDPDDDGPGWRLASTVGDATRRAHRVRVAQRELLLLPRAGEGWWAVDPSCSGCGATLTFAADAQEVEQLTCSGCGLVHAPAGGSAAGPPVMVVDDEIFVYDG